LKGRDYSGSKAGRRHLVTAMTTLGLTAVTAGAPHQIEGLFSIDHIAVPAAWAVRVEHYSALREEGRLSDHDAYVVETAPSEADQSPQWADMRHGGLRTGDTDGEGGRCSRAPRRVV